MRTKSCLAVMVLLLGAGLLSRALAQQSLAASSIDNPAAKSGDPGLLPMVDNNGSWVFRRQVNEVTVMFTATQKGKFVADLQRDDVQVRDDKKPPAEIMDFRNEQDLPLRLGLLIDTSGSVSDRFRFEMQAASQFVKEVVDQQHDEVFVAGFSHRLRMMENFSQDPAKVSRALARLHDDQGDTAVYDSVIQGCKMLAGTPDQQPVARVLVLISDGDDNASNSTLKDALQMAQAEEVTIYAISSNPRGLNPVGDDALERVAEQSGGRALFPASKKQVVRAFARVRDELRNRYAVSYRPAEFKPDGHFRRIKIVARRLGKKLHVRARKGYYARPLVADVMAPTPRP